MVKRSGADHYVPVSWEEAYELIAQELNGLKSPDEAAFWTSGQCSNEAAFVYQLFARAYGTGPLHVARRHHAAGRHAAELRLLMARRRHTSDAVAFPAGGVDSGCRP
ncbi:MAG TPA: molybdopterin-dependent oxidoreductase [Propionibacteriaceae bacterium]|jgi:anaerobic selenocysteine-containing dehydrogenase|nr:molybdopterin-dependent oxidoreductase [Propionibacteriaceae bacterium]